MKFLSLALVAVSFLVSSAVALAQQVADASATATAAVTDACANAVNCVSYDGIAIAGDQKYFLVVLGFLAIAVTTATVVEKVLIKFKLDQTIIGKIVHGIAALEVKQKQ